MKKNEVKVGGCYTAKVSDKLVTVRIDSTHSAGGWNATNTATGKRIRVKSAGRLRGVAKQAGKPGARQTAETAKVKQRNDREKPGHPDSAPTGVEAGKTKKARDAKETKGSEDKPKRLSALDAAAQVLRESTQPMRCPELVAAMADRGLWTSPAGKTPQATLYAAILREINKSVETSKVSRFRKMDRGLFAFNATAQG